MNARTPDDPTLLLWHRVRRPVQILGWSALAVAQIPALTSGRPIRVVGAVLVLAFFASLMLQTRALDGDRTSPSYWRDHGRRMLRFWGCWEIVVLALLAWGQIEYGLRPFAAVYVAVPLLGLASAWFSISRAEKIAAAQATAEARVG